MSFESVNPTIGIRIFKIKFTEDKIRYSYMHIAHTINICIYYIVYIHNCLKVEKIN